jgi:hypothetical protein
MIKEAYCSFEVAKLLKEKGFDCPCLRVYDKNGIICIRYSGFDIPHNYTNIPLYLCPTHQMAMKWLREEKRISIIIEFDLTKRGYCPYVYQLDYDMDWIVKWRINTPMKYEEAIEAALKYSLENLI